MKSTRDKGAELEQFVVDRLRVMKIDLGARRTPGSGQGTRLKADVANGLNLAIECKNADRLPSGAWTQANRQIVGSQAAILVWKPPATMPENSMVMLPWWYFEDLLKKSQEPKTANPDGEFKRKVERLVVSAKAVLKVIGVLFPGPFVAGRENLFKVNKMIAAAKDVIKELD